jgi:hypothetical protein
MRALAAGDRPHSRRRAVRPPRQRACGTVEVAAAETLNVRSAPLEPIVAAVPAARRLNRRQRCFARQRRDLRRRRSGAIRADRIFRHPALAPSD